MPKKINEIGNKYGYLTVIEPAIKKTKSIKWRCFCKCGKFATIDGTKLRNGHTRSCGCLHKEATIAAKKTHGLSKSPIYSIWRDMMRRCNPENKLLCPNYAGRGIKVCKRWHYFGNFHDDTWNAYTDHLREHGKINTTLDRIDVNGDYSPDNCRWATQREQQSNKRCNRWFTYKGETRTMKQWAEETGINYAALSYRINYAGYTIEEALTKPMYGNKSGFKGVHWNKKAKKWQVNFMEKGKNYYAGLFTNKKEAVSAYIKLRKETHAQ